MGEQGWGGGYTESEYTKQAYPELATSILDWAVASKGIESPHLDSGFNYLELGCGFATSLIANAAVHPEGRFYGVDFNPQHIVGGRALARKATLKNVELSDDSFADLLSRDLPQFEYIVLHGVYSWVDAEVRSQVREIIRRKLKPGGVVLISYNCIAGAAQYAALRDVLRLEVARRQGSLDQRVRETIAMLKQWQQAEMPFFVQNPRAARRLDNLLEHGANYVAHEFLNSAWTAFSHAEIAAEMSALKLRFVASAWLLKNFDVSLPPRWQQQIADTTDPVFRETLRDLATQETFRSDIFVRGPLPLAAASLREKQLEGRFALMIPRDAWFKEQNIHGRKISADPTLSQPMLEELDKGPASLRDMCRAPSMAALGSGEVWNRILGLMTSGHILPAMSADRTAACRSSVDRLNHSVLEHTRQHLRNDLQLVSAVTGTVVGLGLFEQLFLLAERRDRASVAALVMQWATEFGGQLILGGVTHDRERGLVELGNRYDSFCQTTRPFLERLGVAAPL